MFLYCKKYLFKIKQSEETFLKAFSAYQGAQDMNINSNNMMLSERAFE